MGHPLLALRTQCNFSFICLWCAFQDEFRALYDYLDRFGLDDEVIEMEEALGMLSSIGDELLSYDELALLLLKLSKR